MNTLRFPGIADVLPNRGGRSGLVGSNDVPMFCRHHHAAEHSSADLLYDRLECARYQGCRAMTILGRERVPNTTIRRIRESPADTSRHDQQLNERVAARRLEFNRLRTPAAATPVLRLPTALTDMWYKYLLVEARPLRDGLGKRRFGMRCEGTVVL